MFTVERHVFHVVKSIIYGSYIYLGGRNGKMSGATYPADVSDVARVAALRRGLNTHLV